MKYQRIPYKAEGTAFTLKKFPFSLGEHAVPVMDYPITPVENFKLAWKHKTPVWAPISQTDFDTISLGKTSPFEKLKMKKERFEFTDEWGCEWVYVPEVGGAMLKPGTKILEDITDWESVLKFPDWKTQDFKTLADGFHSRRANLDTVVSVDIGSGGTERLVAILGGYEEAMLAMAVEPEAVHDFMMAEADNMIRRFDAVKEYYPTINMVTYHDDWGTERDTFFSAQYLEDMVLESTKKLVDHVKASGDICFQLHCCGKVERFVPYMIDLGIDMLEIQRRSNDIPMLKQKYGDKIGFECMIEGTQVSHSMSNEEILEKVKETVELYGKNGGFYLNLGAIRDEKLRWDACYEAYCYSREYYDKERA